MEHPDRPVRIDWQNDDIALHEALRRLEPHAGGRQLPPAPLAAAVLLARDVPSIVTDLLPKAAAGYFLREF